MNRSPVLILLGALLALGFTLPGRTQDAPSTPGLPSQELFDNPTRAEHRFDDFTYPAAERTAEAQEKVGRVRRALAARRLDGLVIAAEPNFAWLTAGGKAAPVSAQREAPVKLMITPERQYLIADNMEGPRIMTEELNGLGYQWIRASWQGDEADVLEPLLRNKKIAFDLEATAAAYRRDPVKDRFDLADVAFPLTAGEVKKYRWLGRKLSAVLEQVAQAVRPGMGERDVQYLVARELYYWDITPTSILTAADDRFKIYAHPVVGGSAIRDMVSLGAAGRRWGLVAAATRVVHFGEPDPNLLKAWEAVARIEAAAWAATRPGRHLSDVLSAARDAYADTGYPDDWKLQSLGGPILNRERLWLVRPGDQTPVTPGMTFAWNPALPGARAEDTVYLKPDGTIENLTAPIKWPTTSVKIGMVTYAVPTLLVRPTQ